jgi:hypothetical protein
MSVSVPISHFPIPRRYWGQMRVPIQLESAEAHLRRVQLQARAVAAAQQSRVRQGLQRVLEQDSMC